MVSEGLCYRHHLHAHIGILPGWPWLEQHEHDLDSWQPEVEMNLGGIKYKIKAADPKVLSQVLKANQTGTPARRGEKA